MTFLSTCCCGSTISPPPPTGCQDVCCQSCFSGSRINDWSGNPIDLNDDLILYQGVKIETDGKSTTPTNYNLENSPATLKLQYKKMGSYWVWWHPSYMCNYTTNIPECESTEFTRLNQVNPDLGDSGGGPEYNLHFGRTLEGDVCSHTLIPNRDASPPDADSEDSFSTNQLYYGGAGLEKGFRAFFNTIKGVAYGEDPFIFRYPTETVFAGVINANSNSGPSVESGYPCSTAGEDECCYTDSTFRQKYVAGTPASIAKNEYCNRMGISPYRRRILREHYPWAFQIFAYNRGLDWPFINNINYFEQNQPETSASGKQISGSAFSTPLRCEHHWGLGEAGACNNAYEDANFPLSFLIPRRFIYGCSAIPFFEFDLHEFAKDYGAIDVSNVITNMRAFTAIFPNPTGNFGIYGQQPYPDQNNTNAVRPILGLMAGQKFVNITAKDWRQEAVEELIIAESYYREALGISGANYDLFAAMMLPRPIPLTGTVEDLRNLSDAQKTETIAKIFGTPLGPIRKRHRALSVPGYFGDIDWDVQYVSIEAGNVHSAGLRSNGTLKCWGSNDAQQSSVPIIDDNIIKFSAGGAHTVVLTNTNNIISWGSNQYGQSSIPIGLTSSSIFEISAGGAHTVALTSSGLTCWGAGLENTGVAPNYGQSIIPPNIGTVNEISAGLLHTAVRLANNNVICWGNNQYGQSTVPPDTKAKQISAGHYHTSVIGLNDKPICWGRNDSNQCVVPTEILNNPNVDIVKISSGGYHTIALDNTGVVYCWGNNDFGQCNVPSSIGQVIDISAGEHFSIALLSDGSIIGWGDNQYGQSELPPGSGPVPTDVNVFMPYDVLSGTYEFLFQNENGDPVEELRQIQAMTYANVFAPIDEIDLKGSYPNETAEQRNLRKLSLIAKLSQITYTYMLMLPGKWDFSAWGPGLAGPGSPPQDNWFFRKYGYVQDPGNGAFPSFARVLAHSQINKCIANDPNEGFLDFAWNPTTNCLFGDCVLRPPFDDPTTGIAIDPYCGRTTYSETPDILFAAHTYPVEGTSPIQDAPCPNVPDNRFFIIQAYGKSELSFVRFQSRGMTWDASVIPHRVISRNAEEIEEYKTKNLGVRLTKTFENCTICYSQACCAQGQDFPCPSPYPEKFSAFNAKCSGVPRHRMPSEGGAAVSGCNGLVIESDGANSIVYDNEIDSISYDFNWYGPIAFRDQNPYSFLPTDQVFTIPGVTIQNLPDCFGYDFCDSFNRTVNNSLNSLSNEGITWIFGLPPNRYWEIPGATGGNPQYPYNLPYSDFVGMFTQECCELMENCPECKLGNNFAEDCAYKAARWCRCPKYPEQGISAWAANGPITNNDPNAFGPWNQGLFGGVSGIVLGYGYSRSADYDFKRWDRDPATGNILITPNGGFINSDQNPRSILEFDTDFELNFINTLSPATGRTWGICSPVTSQGKIMFGSDDQFDCSKIMFNITEEQLRSIGFVNDDMINFYKGSFCGCEGIIVDRNTSSGYEESEFNNDCYNSDNELGNCSPPNYDAMGGGGGYTLGSYKSAVINNPQTPHYTICRYIANSLCGGLNIFGGGVAKFRDIEAPCHLKGSLWNGTELPSTPVEQQGLTGVTCYGTLDYLYSGSCYVAPSTYEEPGSGNFVACQDDGMFGANCVDLLSGLELDPESDCCKECLNSVPPGDFVSSFDCATDCNVSDEDIFVFDTPEEQQNSLWWDQNQFANWARSLGLIGCWKKKT
jgi:hypothetical protein